MIDELESQIVDWITTTLDGVPVQTTAPGTLPENQKKCISLYLLDLLPAAATEQGASKTFHLLLRFLVTAWADTSEESHRLLGILAQSATEHPNYDLELQPLTAQAWEAFGIAPRPSFMLRAQLQKERKLPDVKLIREPMVLRDSPLVTLQGIVVGPNDIPITGAYVELTSLQRSTYTDRHGCFTFSAVPADPPRKRLRVKAKGRELAVLAEHGAHMHEPIIIHLDLMEV